MHSIKTIDNRNNFVTVMLFYMVIEKKNWSRKYELRENWISVYQTSVVHWEMHAYGIELLRIKKDTLHVFNDFGYYFCHILST